MKVGLTVLTPGKMQGKTIGIIVSRFYIGREMQCHLRPASPQISKRHCVLEFRDGKLFVRDFGSTNGTYVNDQRVAEEVELKHDDLLKVGPLEFRAVIDIKAPGPVPKPEALRDQPAQEFAASILPGLPEELPSTQDALQIDDQSTPFERTVRRQHS
jgi:predicted component of type VI protein secretion system